MLISFLVQFITILIGFVISVLGLILHFIQGIFGS